MALNCHLNRMLLDRTYHRKWPWTLRLRSRRIWEGPPLATWSGNSWSCYVPPLHYVLFDRLAADRTSIMSETYTSTRTSENPHLSSDIRKRKYCRLLYRRSTSSSISSTMHKYLSWKFVSTNRWIVAFVPSINVGWDKLRCCSVGYSYRRRIRRCSVRLESPTSIQLKIAGQ